MNAPGWPGATAAGSALSPLHRAYFLMVGLFAMWVGVWGTFIPSRVALALPWPVPALHSRVIGAMYLSGLLLMLACLLRRHAYQVAVGLRMAVVWTGMLLLASLLHLQEFDPNNPRVWFWFFAYLLFPLWGAWLAWRDRASAQPPVDSPAPAWVSAIFVVLGGLFIALAALLFLAPQTMAQAWPWKASVLLLQIYAGPCLSIGIGSWLLTRPRYADEIATSAASMASFVLLVLLASLLHRELFRAGSLSAAAWFSALSLAAAGFLLALASRWRAGGNAG